MFIFIFFISLTFIFVFFVGKRSCRRVSDGLKINLSPETPDSQTCMEILTPALKTFSC